MEEKVEFATPVRATIAPREEENFEGITKERTQIKDKEANRFTRNRKLESTIPQLGDIQLRSRASNGGLQEHTSRVRGETELAATEGRNKKKDERLDPGQVTGSPNLSLVSA